MISGYEGTPVPLSNPLLLLLNRIRIEGSLRGEHIDLWPQALEELAGLVADGKLRPRESIAQGIEATPEAFFGLLKGQNFGKQL